MNLPSIRSSTSCLCWARPPPPPKPRPSPSSSQPGPGAPTAGENGPRHPPDDDGRGKLVRDRLVSVQKVPLGRHVSLTPQGHRHAPNPKTQAPDDLEGQVGRSHLGLRHAHGAEERRREGEDDYLIIVIDKQKNHAAALSKMDEKMQRKGWGRSSLWGFVDSKAHTPLCFVEGAT